MTKKQIREPTLYDGFDMVSFVNRIRQKNLEARNQGLPEPHPLYSLYFPEELQAKVKRWFKVTQVSKCLRWAGYEFLKETGIPRKVEDERRMEKGTNDHFRLQREFRLVFVTRNNKIYDSEYGIYGESDGLARNYITGELFVPEFKTVEEWIFKSRVKREGLPKHLVNTSFYVAVPDDAFQTMLYVRIWRQLIRHPEIPIRFGLVIYENKNNPNERKACLVEYDERLIEKFGQKFQELNRCLDNGENIVAYIPKEAFVHSFCPFRLQCPRGQEAILPKIKKRNISLWVIYQLKKRAKQELPKIEPAQSSLLFPKKEAADETH